MELTDNSSPIQMGALHPRIVKVKNMTMSIYTPFSATETCTSIHIKHESSKGLWPLSRVGVFCTQYRNAATRGRCPESNKGEKKQKNSFWCFLFLPKLK